MHMQPEIKEPPAAVFLYCHLQTQKSADIRCNYLLNADDFCVIIIEYIFLSLSYKMVNAL